MKKKTTQLIFIVVIIIAIVLLGKGLGYIQTGYTTQDFKLMSCVFDEKGLDFETAYQSLDRLGQLDQLIATGQIKPDEVFFVNDDGGDLTLKQCRQFAISMEGTQGLDEDCVYDACVPYASSSTSDLGSNSICGDGIIVEGESCGIGEGCRVDAECIDGLVCNAKEIQDGVFVNTCQVEAEPSTSTPLSCTSITDCLNGKTCVNNVCVTAQQQEDTSNDDNETDSTLFWIVIASIIGAIALLIVALKVWGKR